MQGWEPNSEAAQRSSADSAPAPGVIYKVNSCKASFGELWRDTRSPLVLAAWLTKLLHVRVPGSVNEPNVAALAPFQVPISDLPQKARERIDAGIAELAAVGFDSNPAACYAIADVYNNSRACFALLY